VTLPQTINVTAFLMDPTAGCGDGRSASTREFKIETSTDGVTFHTAYDGTGANEFGEANFGHLNQLVPQAAGTNVRFVRVTMLNPWHQDPDPFCQPNGCSGTDFIDLTEFEVLGGSPNVLPTGTLSVSPSTATVGDPVTFSAHFTDPDSAIASYAWDFDGNGTTDRTTTAATTTFAYAAKGTFAPKVTANDFRGGGTSATSSVKVNAAPPPFPPIATVKIPKRGTHGAISVPVTCFARCTITAKLVISRKLARKLGVGRTVGRKRATTRSSRTVKLKLSKKVLRAMKRKKVKSITGVLTVKAEYVDGRRRLTSKKVTIRR
jgi:hypothetical protein